MTSEAGASVAGAAAKPARTGWRLVLANLSERKVLVMLLLGFSSGIPLYLVGNTLGFWMRENAIELSTIGFLSWVGLAYSLKFLWAPLVDKLDAPLLGRWLGRRRGWMLLSQLVASAALLGMALVEPQKGQLVLGGVALNHLLVFGVLALVVAFASATQDIVIDAWRIESAENAEQQSLLTASGLLGYRAALLVTDSLILILAARVGWVVSYEIMALLLSLGVVAVLLARETRAAAAEAVLEIVDPAEEKLGVSDAMVLRWLAALLIGALALAYLVVAHNLWDVDWNYRDAVFAAGVPLAVWLLLRRSNDGRPVPEATWSRPLVRPLLRFFDAVVGPLLMFLRTHGQWALLMLVAISLYRLPDFVFGPMANPFYADLGMAKETVGAVRGSIGLIATIVGIAAAGVGAVRFGFVPVLLAGAVLGPGSNLAFAYLAMHGGDPTVFAVVMAIDNFSNGFAGVALVGYMSSLTNVGYTATQYALLSSFYALPGKFLKGMSGVAVERLAVDHSLLDAYALFFVGTALIGIPALLLCIVLAVRKPPLVQSAPS
ncbi:AmpG family muropeptide MFS transporter [Lysobacter sp. CA199]|uniref:AmpG family muropeptide MFS transporter n=1 Tax=Lysobacter sp. CA199 TaxID=3455608 RepID=UPI003F8D3453